MSLSIDEAIQLVEDPLPKNQRVIFASQYGDELFLSIGMRALGMGSDSDFLPVPGSQTLVVSKADGSVRNAKTSGSIPYYILGVPPTDDESNMDKATTVFDLYPEEDDE